MADYEICASLINLDRDFIRAERVRDFQPPWRTVYVYRCPSCGAETRVRKSWTGPAPRGAIRCIALVRPGKAGAA